MYIKKIKLFDIFKLILHLLLFLMIDASIKN